MGTDSPSGSSGRMVDGDVGRLVSVSGRFQTGRSGPDSSEGGLPKAEEHLPPLRGLAGRYMGKRMGWLSTLGAYLATLHSLPAGFWPADLLSRGPRRKSLDGVVGRRVISLPPRSV